MCGRYFITSPIAEILALFGVDQRLNLAARHNVAPTQQVPIVTARGKGGRQLTMARWGLIPAWADGPGKTPLHNARGESVAEKPAFREAFAHQRCLIPANGFFDWQAQPGGAKRPYRFGLADGGLFAFGGIFSVWRQTEAMTTLTCAIVTTEANETVRPICHRMPVMLTRCDHHRWLSSSATAAALIRPFSPASIVAVPVSKRVGDVRQDDPGLIEPEAVEFQEQQLALF